MNGMTQRKLDKKLEFAAWLCFFGCIVTLVVSQSLSSPAWCSGLALLAALLGVLCGGLFASSVRPEDSEAPL